MAIKFGRPIEARARFAPVENPAQAQQRLDLTVRMRRNRRTEWARRMVREHRAHHRRPDLAAVRDGRRQRARAGRLDAGRRAALGRPGGARGRARRQARPSPASRCFPTPIRACATKPAARRSTRTTWSAAPSAPSRRRCRRSASCATSRSIPTPATAMTACCATASSSTTRRSRCWSSRRWCRREAGCDIIAPSDMMDGRVGAIRQGLDAADFTRRARSWPTRRNTPPPSTARSATRSARPRR